MKLKIALATAAVIITGVVLSHCEREPAPRAEPVETAEPAEPTVVATPKDVAPVIVPSADAEQSEIEDRSTETDLHRRWPVTTVLPKDTVGWRMDYRVDGDRLVLRVTLRVIFNRAAQRPQAEADYERYRAEALTFLAASGVDATAYPIEWNPPHL